MRVWAGWPGRVAARCCRFHGADQHGHPRCNAGNGVVGRRVFSLPTSWVRGHVSTFDLPPPEGLSRVVAGPLPAAGPGGGLGNLLPGERRHNCVPGMPGAMSCGRRRSHGWLDVEEVVVDVLLSLVAKECDDVPQGRV